MTVPPRDPLAGVLRHGAWNAAATLVPGLYALALGGTLLHTLGPGGYAVWAAGAALIGWLTLLDAGLSSTTVREASRALAGEEDAVERARAASAAFAGAAALALPLGVGGAAVLPAILKLDGGPATIAWATGALLAIDLAVVIATSGWTGILRGARRFDLLLAVNVVHVAVAVGLLVVLLPPLGLPGAATAQVVGRLVSRATLARLLRRRIPWFRAIPRWPGWPRLRGVWAFSAPIMALQLATQIGIGSDLFVVGAAAGATAVGLYAAGAQLVRYTAQFLYPALGVLLPSFSAADYLTPSEPRTVLEPALRVATLVGTVGFGALAAMATPVLLVWSGQASGLSVAALVLYAVAFVVVTPAHVLTLMLVARGSHGILGALVLTEAVVNLVLSIVLVARIGPVGAAVSSLVVILVDDAIVIPWVAARRLGISYRSIVEPIVTGFGIGLALVAGAMILPIEGLLGIAVRLPLLGVAMLVIAHRLLRGDRPPGAADKARARAA